MYINIYIYIFCVYIYIYVVSPHRYGEKGPGDWDHVLRCCGCIYSRADITLIWGGPITKAGPFQNSQVFLAIFLSYLGLEGPLTHILED